MDLFSCLFVELWEESCFLLALLWVFLWILFVSCGVWMFPSRPCFESCLWVLFHAGLVVNLFVDLVWILVGLWRDLFPGLPCWGSGDVVYFCCSFLVSCDWDLFQVGFCFLLWCLSGGCCWCSFVVGE